MSNPSGTLFIAMKKSNLYTATGDDGTTSLVAGQRVSKADDRLEAYGTIDELNSFIGVLVAIVFGVMQKYMHTNEVEEVKKRERKHRVFTIEKAPKRNFE